MERVEWTISPEMERAFLLNKLEFTKAVINAECPNIVSSTVGYSPRGVVVKGVDTPMAFDQPERNLR
jgi:hypothetical protein